MALVDPYCTLAEADSYLSASVAWAEASTTQKNAGLFWGRMYLDAHFHCDYHDPDNPSDEIKYANALLAEDHVEGKLPSQRTTSGGGGIRRTSKGVGSLQETIEYFDDVDIKITDNQADVKMLLNEQCSFSGVGSVRLDRN